MTATAPATLPARAYRSDPALFAAERQGVFARSWQFVGHEADLAVPGDYIALTTAGFPIIVVRGEDSQIYGHHNVCRHRAGPLAPDGAGRCAGLLACRYHGWTYALDGRLRSARDFGAAAGFDPRDYGLFPARTQTFKGLVFLALGPEAPPLDGLLAPLSARLASRDWSALKPSLTRSHLIGCNWKTYVENYLEGYHVPAVHPGLDAEIDASRYAVSVEGRIVFHEAPLRAPNPVYEGLWAYMWPNTGFNIYGEGLMMERMSPVGSDAIRLDYVYLTPGGAPTPSETLALSDAVLAEDTSVVEAVQRNLNAGVYAAGRLSPRHEVAVAAFQSWISEACPDASAA